MAKSERLMKEQNAKNEAWYKRRYNQDYLDTAAGQNIMRQAKEYGDRTWKKASGAAAVGGGTESAAAMAKESANKMVGDTAANIASADVQRKENVDNIHHSDTQNYTNQQMQLAQQKAANISQAAAGASNAIMQAGALASGATNGKTTAQNTANSAVKPSDKEVYQGYDFA